MKALRERIQFSDHVYQLAANHPVLRKESVRNATFGFLLCTGAAIAVTVLLRRTSATESLPLLFLMIVAAVAHRFGTSGAMLGLIGGAVVFSRYMFAPLGELNIAEGTARTNVVMMVLFGVAVAYFYGSSKSEDDSEGESEDKK